MGSRTLTVRFGNGSLTADGAPAPSSHGVTVNGCASGEVRYPYTGWDNWQYASLPVGLREGWNTIRLAKSDLYAELDSIEVA